MSAYLKFYALEHSPFDTGPQSSLVLGTQALRDAFAQIEAGIAEGAPRICVTGASGLGKTSLARALPKLLRGEARVVLLLNPALPWSTLRSAIVRQLDLDGGVLSRTTLLSSREVGQRLVVVVDAAEKIGREALEHFDALLGYRTDDDRQLVHCVLLANLEHARAQSDCPLLWWLDSLNTLQLEFAPIPVKGVRSYILKHLKRAGWKGGELFTPDAARAIHRLTGGVPRAVSELCERVLEAAAARGAARIDAPLVEVIAGERPADGPPGPGDASEVEEMLLETVVASPARDDTGASQHEEVPTPPARSRPAAERRPPGYGTSDERASGRVASAGLDAFFGPSDAPASAPRAPTAPTAPTTADDAMSASTAPAETEREAELWPDHTPDAGRGGMLRKAAVAAAIVALVAAGAIAARLLVSGEPDPPRTGVAHAGAEASSTRAQPSRASTGAPEAAQRLARPPEHATESMDATAAARGSADAQARTPATIAGLDDAIVIDEPSTALSDAADDAPAAPESLAARREVPADPTADATTTAEGIAPAPADPVPASPGPASPSRYDDRMDASDERHF